MDKRLAELSESGRDAPSMELIVAVMLLIWRSRNSFIFQVHRPKPSLIMETALATIKNYRRWSPRSRRNRQCEDHSPSQPTRWCPLEKGLPQAKCGWIMAQGGAMGSSAVDDVCRDSTGLLVASFAKQIHASSAVGAEALAVQEGIYSTCWGEVIYRTILI